MFYNIGSLFFKNKQIELAIENLSKSLQLDPTYVDGHYQLGLTNINMGDIEKAKVRFMKVIELVSETQKASQTKNLLEHLK